MKQYTCPLNVNIAADNPREAHERLMLLRDFIKQQTWVNWIDHPDDVEDEDDE